jgi:hypothetical protein
MDGVDTWTPSCTSTMAAMDLVRPTAWRLEKMIGLSAPWPVDGGEDEDPDAGAA